MEEGWDVEEGGMGGSHACKESGDVGTGILGLGWSLDEWGRRVREGEYVESGVMGLVKTWAGKRGGWEYRSGVPGLLWQEVWMY